MDDKFLYQNRPSLSPGFGEALYARISKPQLARSSSRKNIWMIFKFAAIAVFLLAALLLFSQPVRADVLYWIKQLAGLTVEEKNDVSIGDESGTVSTQSVSRGSLEDLNKALPYDLNLPTYIPKGYTFENNKVEVQETSVFMRWLDKDGKEILMLVDTDHGQRYIMGENASTEIWVNDMPALLVQGYYGVDGLWDPNLKVINLIQKHGDVIYWLIYVHNSDEVYDAEFISDELIQMMQTIP